MLGDEPRNGLPDGVGPPRRGPATFQAMADAATDIVMLTHNRLDYLVATVEALEQRTRAPYRLTIVDNASDPDVRNWLAENRDRFHQLILLGANEFLTALNRGIAATTSDPYMVTDPDLIVPDLEPCWLTRMHALMEEHPDFGLVGIGLDQSNLPSVQDAESIDPGEIVDGEIVERAVGSVFTLIRRDALRSPYDTDWHTCQSVARAGYRYGWALDIRAYHLGWDDYKLYPAHLASKLVHGEYREVNLIERAPTLSELALAGPLVAETRRLGVPDAAVLELTWGEPAIAASLPSAVALPRPETGPLPFDDDAAGAVVLVDPPAERADELLREAHRVATHAVLVVGSLASLGSRTAGELAPAGWTGHEAHGPGDVSLELAAAACGDAGIQAKLGPRTIDDRERWLAMFAAGAFGVGTRRLWIWTPREAASECPEAVRWDPARVQPWRPVAVTPTPPHRTLAERLSRRARREWAVASEVVRIRAARLRSALSGRAA